MESILLFQAGQEFGPYTLEQIREMIVAGQVDSEAFFWQEGMTDWSSVFPADLNQTGSPKQLARLQYFGVVGSLNRKWANEFIDLDEKDSSQRGKIAQWHIDKHRLYPEIFALPARTHEEAENWEWHFGDDGLYGFEFHQPTPDQILLVLRALDEKIPGWDRGPDIESREKNFIAELALLFPSLRKQETVAPARKSVVEDMPPANETFVDRMLRERRERIAQRAAFLSQKYSDSEVARRLAEGELWIGQTEEQVEDALFPSFVDAREQKVSKSKIRTILKFDQLSANRFALKVTLENGAVVSWDDKR